MSRVRSLLVDVVWFVLAFGTVAAALPRPEACALPASLAHVEAR